MSLVWSVKSLDAAPATGSVYDELTATINFNDDNINLIYVDWDDGPSNKLNESNYQWIRTPDPSGSIDVKHTYTAADTFYPVVQSVTSEGYVSRYYSAVSATAADITPHTTDTAVSGVTILDSTATAIMRVENRTVKSGVDNSIFEEGPKILYAAIPPLISQSDIANVTNPKLEIEVLLAGGLYDSTGSGMGPDIGRTIAYKKLSFTLTNLNTGAGLYDCLSGSGVSGASVAEVLSVKYVNPRPSSDTYANYDIYNKLKLFIVASGNDGNFYPITYVSAGSPLKKADDLLRYSTLDFSQGRTAASNKSISYYRYDNGKAWFNPINQWAITSSTTLTGNAFTDATRVTNSLKPISYTYMPHPGALNVSDGNGNISSGSSYAISNADNAYWFTSGNIGTTGNQATRTDQFAIDDFGRFYEQYHFVRNTVEPNSSATYTSSLSGNNIQGGLFQPSSWGPSDENTACLRPVIMGGDGRIAPFAWANGSGTSLPLEGINSEDVIDYTSQTNPNAKYYMTLLMPKKTNKFFFNFSNYAQGLQYNSTSSSNKRLKIGGIYYLHVENSGTITQNCFWKPLEFEDTTKITKEIRDTSNGKYVISGGSFSKSGYITFDMPTDWSNISWTTVCGGVYDDSGSIHAPVEPPYWDWPTASTDIDITGTQNASGNTTGYGGSCNILLTTDSRDAMRAALGTGTTGSDQVGAWKYTFYCTGGAASGAAYWIATGASNGWDGARDMNIHFGERGGASLAAHSPDIAGETLSGRVRRINAYEVMDGAWKGTSGSTASPNAEIIPVGLNTTLFNQSMSMYNKNTWNAATTTNDAIFGGATPTMDWATQDLYPIKIVFDGQTAIASGTSTDGAAPTLNNLFPANEGYTTIIKEIDDSAYSLNTLPITSDMSYSREGNYYTAITRKGKVFIAKTGIKIQELSFTSVALGDESTATVSSTGADSLYGYLHTTRRLYEENVRAYWDEKQKDGTYVRFWGIITSVDETRGTGGPRAIKEYSFSMTVENIALLDNSGEFMTDIFPLGGVQDERSFT